MVTRGTHDPKLQVRFLATPPSLPLPVDPDLGLRSPMVRFDSWERRHSPTHGGQYPLHGCDQGSIPCGTTNAGVAEMADALRLERSVLEACRFDSCHRYHH